MQAVIWARAGENHEQYVMKAIASSKPVFCEKLLETTADVCTRVVKAEMNSGAAFYRCYDPPCNSLKEVVARGVLPSSYTALIETQVWAPHNVNHTGALSVPGVF